MPRQNHFRHHQYHAGIPAIPPRLIRADLPPAPGTEAFHRRMQDVGDAFRRAGVEAIYLVHGTFVGQDALGWLSELSRIWPAAGELLRRHHKKLFDSWLKDAGNYTADFAAAFQTAINRPDDKPIEVRLFDWSGENNHIGRSDGAVGLLDELFHRSEASIIDGKPRRFLLWGHSHAGNVFALASNLLAADAEVRELFFEAARYYYRWPLLGFIDHLAWPRVKELLPAVDHPLRKTALDFVTFGTPVRYGWDVDGYAKLMHIVYHRPTAGLAEHLAPFPPKADDLLLARGGDYVQQTGIAGSNFMPYLLAPRTLWAERNLTRLLQNGIRARDLLAHLKIGMRAPDDGETLLVDYGPMSGAIHEHAAGHAVYTRLEWLLFHAEEVAKQYERY